MKSFNDAPLPDFLTIKKSPSGGLGLFVKKNERLFFYQHIGITHYIVDGGIMVTPLGGFIKYSDKPNCILSPCNNDGKDVSYGKQTAYKLTPSVYSIHGGEELTLDYRKYEWIFSGDLNFPPIHKQTLSGAGHRYGIYENMFANIRVGCLGVPGSSPRCYSNDDCAPGYKCVNGVPTKYHPVV